MQTQHLIYAAPLEYHDKEAVNWWNSNDLCTSDHVDNVQILFLWAFLTFESR